MNPPESKLGVGYKRPPHHSRFKPGESGNPSGRPRRAPRFADDVETELQAETTIRESGGTATVTNQRAIAKRLIEAAKDGDVKAITELAKCQRQLAERADAATDEDASADLEAVEAFIHAEVERRIAELLPARLEAEVALRLGQQMLPAPSSEERSPDKGDAK